MIIKDINGNRLKLTTKRLRELSRGEDWAVLAEDFRTAFRKNRFYVRLEALNSQGRLAGFRLHVDFSKPGINGDTTPGRIGCKLFSPVVFKTIVNALVYGKLATKKLTKKSSPAKRAMTAYNRALAAKAGR
jgi:hypothetical protein